MIKEPQQGTAAEAKRLVILCPVFNDWASFKLLVRDIGLSLGDSGYRIRLLAVDDGSTVDPEVFAAGDCKGLERVDVLHLLTNLGHQRAIATGLAHIFRDGDFDAVIVMDADGEDRPADLSQLLSLHQERPDQVLLVSRGRRSEGFSFRAFYVVYRILFWLATGVPIRHGNFTLIPRDSLSSILASSQVWNHLAGTILRSPVAKTELRLPRGERYAGQSRMNFVSLVLHGLGAVSVYVDIVMVRIALWSGLMALASLAALVGVVAVRYATELAIPGWATNAAGMALLLLLQNVGLSLIALFILLSLRSQPTFLPLTDAQRYERSLQRLFPKPT